MSYTKPADCTAVPGSVPPSSVPRVMGLLMVVLAVVGLLQSAAGLRAAPDLQAFLLLGDNLSKWEAFGFWMNLTGLVVGALHLGAGVAAARLNRRAPRLALVYAAVAVARLIALVILYYRTTAPVLRPLNKTELFDGHDVGFLLGASVALGWAVLVALLLNLRNPTTAPRC